MTVGNDDAIILRNLATGESAAIREGSAPFNTVAAVFGSFFNPVVNDQGTILFFASLRGAGVTAATDTGLWMRQSMQTIPRVVAREGHLAVGKVGAILPGVAWKQFTSYVLPDGPGAGPIFLAGLAGTGVNAKNELGIWAVDSTGKLRLLLRTYETIPAGATFKTVSEIALFDSLPGSFGARRSYNATGSIAVLATFTDTTQALLRIDIP